MDCNGPSNSQVQRIWAHNAELAHEKALQPILEELKEMRKEIEELKKFGTTPLQNAYKDWLIKRYGGMEKWH